MQDADMLTALGFYLVSREALSDISPFLVSLSSGVVIITMLAF